MIHLTIIIVSYNTKDLLKKCIESMHKYLPKSLFELIVVDNASTDGTIESMSNFPAYGGTPTENYQRDKLIKNRENVGFAKACNIGAKVAKGKYLLFLNSDTQLQDKTIEDMVSFIDLNEKIGIVGGMLLNADGSYQRTFARFYTLPFVFTMLVGGDKVEMLGNQLKKEKKVDWVSGGFMLIRKTLFEELNGFDESFFMYLEDMELCYRMREIGYQTYIYPQAAALHVGQGSSNRSFAVAHIYAGLLYFYKKHLNSVEYITLKIVLRIKAIMLICLGSLTGNMYLKKTYRQAIKM